jgi:pSer/pThr/pTyr-binding forkhead associated (FHA) protein
LVLGGQAVSRHHAIVFRQAGEIWVKDLHSANGTSVDGLELGEEPRRAGFGSLLRIANQSFRILRCQS